MAAKTDDVYVVEHAPYYVTFDWYSPRPHMIILGTADSEKHFLKSMRSSGPEMNNNEKTKMIETAKMVYIRLTESQGSALQNVPTIDSPAVLSVHFGSWFGKGCKHFHAHVTIPISNYVNWLAGYRNPVMERKLKDARQTYDTYIQKARQPPKNYTADEMKMINSHLGKHGLVDDWTKYAFHEKYMRIGFISTASKDMLTLLKEMDAFVMKHELHKKGGHICIDLTSKGFSGFRRLSDEATVNKSYVQGYLQLSGDTFAMFLNGANQGAAWMKNDHTDIGLVYT